MKHPFRLDAKRQRSVILGLALACIALLVHEIFGEHGYLALRRERQELNSLQEEIRRLEQENRQLEIQIKALKSDPKAIEKQAREGLGLARPGELIFTLPPKQPAADAPPTAAKETPPK